MTRPFATDDGIRDGALVWAPAIGRCTVLGFDGADAIVDCDRCEVVLRIARRRLIPAAVAAVMPACALSNHWGHA